MQAAVIRVERDLEGVREAVLALFEESFQRGAIESTSLIGDVDARRRALDTIDERKLSPGYYTRASYLLQLKQSVECGAQVSASELTHDDVAGLQAVARAKAEFEREHPACGSCGTRQDNRFALQCRGCGMKFARGGN